MPGGATQRDRCVIIRAVNKLIMFPIFHWFYVLSKKQHGHLSVCVVFFISWAWATPTMSESRPSSVLYKSKTSSRYLQVAATVQHGLHRLCRHVLQVQTHTHWLIFSVSHFFFFFFCVIIQYYCILDTVFFIAFRLAVFYYYSNLILLKEYSYYPVSFLVLLHKRFLQICNKDIKTNCTLKF